MPVTVTTVPPPLGPLLAATLVTVGAAIGAPVNVNMSAELVALEPPGVVTMMSPVAAPPGMKTESCASDNTAKRRPTETPPTVTAVAPVKAVPVTSTSVPEGPLVGVMAVTAGALTAAWLTRG